LLIAIASTASLATPAAAITPPAGTPDLSLMVLQPTDFSSTTVLNEGYQKDADYVAVYGRDFGPTVTRSGTPLDSAYSEVDLESDLETASLDSLLLYAAVHTKAFRRTLVSNLAETATSEFRVKVTRKDILVGRLRSLHVGQDSVLVPITIRMRPQSVHLYLGFFRFNRAQASFALEATRGHAVSLSEATSIAGLMAADMKLGLSPQVTSLPTIAGTPTQGLVVSVTPGTWLNNPGSYSYQWERCDAAGANCVAITGETGLTYTVRAADVGSTLRVAVIATNTVGSSKPAESVPTPVVR
jgi:hypothetical protein